MSIVYEDDYGTVQTMRKRATTNQGRIISGTSSINASTTGQWEVDQILKYEDKMNEHITNLVVSLGEDLRLSVDDINGIKKIVKGKIDKIPSSIKNTGDLGWLNRIVQSTVNEYYEDKV